MDDPGRSKHGAQLSLANQTPAAAQMAAKLRADGAGAIRRAGTHVSEPQIEGDLYGAGLVAHRHKVVAGGDGLLNEGRGTRGNGKRQHEESSGFNHFDFSVRVFFVPKEAAAIMTLGNAGAIASKIRLNRDFVRCMKTNSLHLHGASRTSVRSFNSLVEDCRWKFWETLKKIGNLSREPEAAQVIIKHFSTQNFPA